MDGLMRDVHHTKLVPFGCSRHRRQKKIRKVFVIDRIEFTMFDEINHVRHLNDKKPFLVQNSLNASQKRVNIIHMSKDIGRRDDVKFSMLFKNGFRQS